MGVFLEIKALGLPAGTVVNLVFAVYLATRFVYTGAKPCSRTFPSAAPA